MKSILFILSAILACQFSSAQKIAKTDKIVNTDKISFVVPSTAMEIPINNTLLLKNLNPNFVIARVTNPKRQLIQIGDLIIQQHVNDFDNLPRYMEDLRNTFFYDAKLLPKRKYTISDYKVLNNFKYFVVEYESKEEPGVYIMYFAVNTSGTKLLTGAAEYPKTSKTLSKRAFSDFLNSIKFK